LHGVTPAQVQTAIAEAFPSPDAVAIVLIGDAAKIADQAQRYGPVTCMPLTRPDFATSVAGTSLSIPREAGGASSDSQHWA
jgi:hypothetical protein